MSESDIKLEINDLLPRSHVLKITHYGKSYDIVLLITEKTSFDSISHLKKLFCVMYFVITPCLIDELPVIKINFSIVKA